MAVMKLSALVSEMKGNLNGTTFLQSQGGQTCKTRIAGGGFNSKIWQYQKGVLGSISSQWKRLTNPQKQAWDMAGPNYPTVDKFGNPRIPSGYELYVRLNIPLYRAGLALLVLPLPPGVFETYGPITLTMDNNGPCLLTINNLTTVAVQLNVYCTPPLSAGKARIQTRWRFLQTFNSSAGVVENIRATYLARYGNIPTGAIVQVKTEQMIIATGQLGQIEYAFATVVP